MERSPFPLGFSQSRLRQGHAHNM